MIGTTEKVSLVMRFATGDEMASITKALLQEKAKLSGAYLYTQQQQVDLFEGSKDI